MKKKVYLAGPITGIKDDNKPAFKKGAKKLRKLGYEVITPFDIDIPDIPEPIGDFEQAYWNYYMKECLCYLLDNHFDMYIFLEGWQSSNGAYLEFTLGCSMNMVMYDIHDILAGNGERLHDACFIQNSSVKSDSNEPDPTVAKRYNTGKPQLSFNLLCPAVLELEARVWEKGAEKYDAGNWLKGQSAMSSADSLLRHLTSFLAGEDIDPESGLNHLGHIITSAKILANGCINHPEKFDDRPRDEIVKET
jgi:hypothetical protein